MVEKQKARCRNLLDSGLEHPGGVLLGVQYSGDVCIRCEEGVEARPLVHVDVLTECGRGLGTRIAKRAVGGTIPTQRYRRACGRGVHFELSGEIVVHVKVHSPSQALRQMLRRTEEEYTAW